MSHQNSQGWITEDFIFWGRQTSVQNLVPIHQIVSYTLVWNQKRWTNKATWLTVTKKQNNCSHFSGSISNSSSRLIQLFHMGLDTFLGPTSSSYPFQMFHDPKECSRGITSVLKLRKWCTALPLRQFCDAGTTTVPSTYAVIFFSLNPWC